MNSYKKIEQSKIRGKHEIFGSKVLTQISSGAPEALMYFNGNFVIKYPEFALFDQ